MVKFLIFQGPTRRIIKKPLIGAISGYCVAGGLELALLCDLRVMEADAVMGFYNRRFGVPLVDGGTVRLAPMIGLSRALDLVLTGRQITSKEALEIGLANRVVATGTSLGQALNLAQSIAKFPQACVNHDRDSLYNAVYNSNNKDEALDFELMSSGVEIIEEAKAGAEKFINEGLGKHGSFSDIKPKETAEWEKEEIKIEKEKTKAE
jgi:enoyl-CoA hydratase/carnithine racemase